MIRTIKAVEGEEVLVKHFKAPIRFSIKCQHCIERIDVDWEEIPTFYPDVGVMYEETAYCDNCDEVTLYNNRLNISVDVEEIEA